MEGRRLAPTLAALASALLVVAVWLPRVVLPAQEASGLGVYYAQGLVGARAVGLVALVAVVVFAAGARERTDPVTAAAAGLVLGVCAALVAVGWALAVPTELVLQLGTADWLEHHRWVVAGLAVAVAALAVWYVLALDLVGGETG